MQINLTDRGSFHSANKHAPIDPNGIEGMRGHERLEEKYKTSWLFLRKGERQRQMDKPVLFI